MIRNIYIYIYI